MKRTFFVLFIVLLAAGFAGSLAAQGLPSKPNPQPPRVDEAELFWCCIEPGMKAMRFEQGSPPKKKGNRFVRWLAAPWKDPKLMLAMGIQAAAMSADYYTTARLRDTCPSCRERSFPLGPRPSNARMVGVGIGGWMAQVYWVKFTKDWSLREAARLENSPGERRFFSYLWLTHPALLTAGHTAAAKANSNIFCPGGMIRTGSGCKFR